MAVSDKQKLDLLRQRNFYPLSLHKEWMVCKSLETESEKPPTKNKQTNKKIEVCNVSDD